MANTDLYEQFMPAERLTLVLEAMARADEAEADKLARTCPRKTYTMGDAAYTDRLEAASDVMLVSLVDFKALCGKLAVLEAVLADLGELDRYHRVNATLAFLDGVRHGQGRPPLEVDGPAEGDVHAERVGEDGADEEAADVAVGEQEDEDDAGEEAGIAVFEAGGSVEEAVAAAVRARDDNAFADRVEAVNGWSQQASGRTKRILEATAERVAQELVDGWAGLGRFGRRRLGVDAATLVRAWWPGAADILLEVLGRYGHLTPAEDAAAEYAGMLEKAWDSRFGTAVVSVTSSGPTG